MSTDRSSDPPVDLTLRPVTDEDASAVADLHLDARAAAVPLMPPLVHPADEVRAHVRSLVVGASQRDDEPAAGRPEVWVAEQGGELVGYLVLQDAWLESLYVRPRSQRQGVGSLLLDLAQHLRPDGFSLWVFESNTPARDFYERRGLVTLERTDGAENEERAPDIRMAWPGRHPVEFLRGQVDEVDASLARLLARRTALTAAIQRYKPVGGHGGRDARREAEIAARMAEHTPALGVDRLARIMAVVISESLDAAEATRTRT